MDRRTFLKGSTALAAGGVVAGPAVMAPRDAAAQRAETLLVVAEGGVNSLDIQVTGANRPTFGLAWNVYDRLVTFGQKRLPDGVLSHDYRNLRPELAQEFQEASNGMSATFQLRRDAKFHDGRPVTARDVKYSFDRAVSVGGFPTSQMAAGSMTKPEQFVVVDDHTFRVDYVRRDRLTLPNLATLAGVVVNSEVVKANAKSDDPWGMQFTRNNAVGGGAYRIEAWRPNQETIYARNEDWKSGAPPRVRRIIFREVPSAGNRRALLERGDADLSFDLPPRDVAELKTAGKLKIDGTPMQNTYQFIGMNVSKAPFDNVKVRQAICFALPYQRIQDAAMFGRARMLSGGASATPTTAEWPQAIPYTTDLARAKAMLAEAGFPNGFETQFSFEVSAATINEPLAVLIQESLAQIGIRMTINKVPAGQLRGLLARKELPFYVDTFGAWFDDPDYSFFLTHHGNNGPWNSASYVNPEMTRLIEAAKDERDGGKYEELVKQMIAIAFRDVSMVGIFQPFLDVAMQPSISGYQYIFHRQLEFRTLVKGA
jgi:peptide/nickel transport system substrate-binding protein